MERSFCPVSSAALAASSCSACFLLLTFNAGRIASGATRSVIGMEGFRGELNRQVPNWPAWKETTPGRRQEGEAGGGLSPDPDVGRFYSNAIPVPTPACGFATVIVKTCGCYGGSLARAYLPDLPPGGSIQPTLPSARR